LGKANGEDVKENSMKILIFFPGGLGDFLMFTPALRRYTKENPNHEITIATHKNNYLTHIFDNHPYIKGGYVHTPHPWVDYNENYIAGCSDIIDNYLPKHCNKFDSVINIVKLPNMHKIYKYAQEMCVSLVTDYLDVFIPNEIVETVDKDLKEKGIDKFNLIHSVSGNPVKNIPKHLQEMFKQESNVPVIAINKSNPHENINYTFELIKRASKLFVCDSVCMHAADALKKENTIIFRKENVPWEWNYVKPLHIKYKEVISK